MLEAASEYQSAYPNSSSCHTFWKWSGSRASEAEGASKRYLGKGDPFWKSSASLPLRLFELAGVDRIGVCPIKAAICHEDNHFQAWTLQSWSTPHLLYDHSLKSAVTEKD